MLNNRPPRSRHNDQTQTNSSLKWTIRNMTVRTCHFSQVNINYFGLPLLELQPINPARWVVSVDEFETGDSLKHSPRRSVFRAMGKCENTAPANEYWISTTSLYCIITYTRESLGLAIFAIGSPALRGQHRRVQFTATLSSYGKFDHLIPLRPFLHSKRWTIRTTTPSPPQKQTGVN